VDGFSFTLSLPKQECVQQFVEDDMSAFVFELLCVVCCHLHFVTSTLSSSHIFALCLLEERQGDSHESHVSYFIRLSCPHIQGYLGQMREEVGGIITNLQKRNKDLSRY
jgi:hypothetical protein